MQMKDISKKREIIIAVICWILMPIYLYFLVSLTFRGRGCGPRMIKVAPFFELRNMIRSKRYVYWGKQILGNIVLLLPLGVMLPAMFEKLRSPKRIAAVGFCTSLGIEVLQCLSRRGVFEFDDLMHNTAGALIGYGLYYLIDQKVHNRKQTVNKT